MKKVIFILQPVKHRCARSAFTLVETLVSLAVIGVAVVGLFGAIAKINEFAWVNRLNTCAFEIVQARADKAFSVRPFTPINGSDPFIKSGTNPLASSLMLCGTNNVVLGTPCKETVNILVDSDNLYTTGSSVAVITGTLTTIIQNASIVTGGTTSSSGTAQLRWINMNLDYRFKGKPYNVQMTCLRAPEI